MPVLLSALNERPFYPPHVNCNTVFLGSVLICHFDKISDGRPYVWLPLPLASCLLLRLLGHGVPCPQ